jgi:dihydrofolate synthase / folylpolyglutamate synthase
MFVTLADWLNYLEQLHPKTIELGLARVNAVREKLSLNPQFPIITVGGTNGKGSTCAMLEAMLHAAGYRVGCYTSPHIIDYNERVRIDKQAVGDEALCEAFAKVERARGDISLTYFEFGTLAAMQLFIDQGLDAAILEVGLGGRLDAVNVFDADCSVVTSIDIDHTDYLGETREEIAYEKAGIFRAGRVAIYGDRDMPRAITSEALRIGAQLWRMGEQFAPPPIPASPLRGRESLQWNYIGPGGARNALPYPALRGAYQLNNASAALAALDALKEKLPVSMEAVRRGLVELHLAGRFQVLPGKPMQILDVAHNPQAARSLAANLAALPPARTWAVFAMLKDKDMSGVVQALNLQIDVWLVSGIAQPRGAAASDLVEVLRGEGVTGEIRQFSSISDAWTLACNEAAENDRIAAFGSFYTVAAVMQARNLRGHDGAQR